MEELELDMAFQLRRVLHVLSKSYAGLQLASH